MRAALVMMVLPVLLVAGCAADIEYRDAQTPETVTVGFGSTDLQLIASKMVNDLLSFDPVMERIEGRRPVILIAGVTNRTTEHINTKGITNSIQTALIQSGKFRFVAPEMRERVRQELIYQNRSGVVDPATATAMGQKVGADYMMYGSLMSIVKRNDGVKDVYYKFTLKLLNLKTGIIAWASEKEIRKRRERSLFGI